MSLVGIFRWIYSIILISSPFFYQKAEADENAFFFPQQLSDFINLVVLYSPLGTIGVWRWSFWILKKLIGSTYKPVKDTGFSTSLSIVTPVYNEDPHVFQKALNSWKKSNPQEIIAVIDYSDESSIEIFRKFSSQFTNSKLIVTKTPGKRSALADGVKAANGEVVALVDSDTLWDQNIRGKILAPFSDPKVGGVGTRQAILEGDTIAKRLFGINLDLRYFHEMPFLARVGNALTCLSGRTALYRREAIIRVVDEMVQETFWGQKCISGEDKCLTRLVQAQGWKTVYQMNACVRTPGMDKVSSFFKQQIRWIRNSWRSDIKSLGSKWIWQKEKFLAIHMLDRFIQPFLLMLGPIYLGLSIYWGNYLAALIIVVWWHLSRTIKIIPHLRHAPLDILILPIYVVSVYVVSVIKIYDLFTISKQGWITRWDKSRLKTVDFWQTVPAYVGTALVIFFLSLGVYRYKNTSEVLAKTLVFDQAVLGQNQVDYASLQNINTSGTKQEILANLENNHFGYYIVRKKDTLWEIAQRYNSNLLAIILANKNTIPNPNKINVGQLIKIPVSELRNTLDKGRLNYAVLPVITLDKVTGTINVSGEGTTVNLSQIDRVLKDPQILQDLGSKEWILRANLFVRKDVTLVLDGEEASWLKLLSEPGRFATMRSYNGRILIQNTKITSWQETTNDFDFNTKDGRSFILAKYSGRMDVLNSEIAYLGYGLYRISESADDPYGGSYGLSWKLPNNSAEYLITGSVINSKIHNNYYGVYTFGASGMIIFGNEVYDNVQYGIDPHDDSNNLLIENNKTYNNGNHGIIISKRCINNIIRGNISYDNRLHGIMLDQASDNNLVEKNIVDGNVDGIAIYDSKNNLIRENSLEGNDNGIRANINSSGNYLENNSIINNDNGVYFYDEANYNFVIGNTIKNNKSGVYLRNASGNLIKNSLEEGDNQRNIKLKDAERNLF